LPVAFQPIKIGDQLLMDGGVANPVPANIARQMGADFVIAVDVSSRWMRIDGDLADSHNAPSFIENAFSVMEYEVAQQVLKQADIVMRPPVMNYDWLEFSRAKEIIAAGEEEAGRNMAEIRKKGGYPKEPPKTIVEAVTDFFNTENL